MPYNNVSNFQFTYKIPDFNSLKLSLFHKQLTSSLAKKIVQRPIMLLMTTPRKKSDNGNVNSMTECDSTETPKNKFTKNSRILKKSCYRRRDTGK